MKEFVFQIFNPLLLLVILSGAILFSCCGYHFNDNSGLAAKYTSISVPYVEGDLDGSLTAAIIHEFVRSGSFEYRRTGGALVLKVSIIDDRNDNIGFRYDRKKDGERRRSIIPTETRRISFVEIKVEDTSSSAIVLGPVQISANVAFDHDYEYARDEVNVFSLGQLSDFNQAVDAAQAPLNQVLARKIVDYVTYSWVQ
ncbi:MAG: hypothetical protein H0X29_00950 [Parachlamydiaceae bacterium]|nr:hypothetical protein [Parachlamydiaceae bacterium]